ncbi:MAG: SbtA family thio(seleno)oxazole RiPP natural product precursor [Thermodesulfobacteriota bacterium]|nr:SbtA family thio(seleno)oxazole RiPP natural product precursor [Thermodesulfobacteriota bacterium]
MARNRLRKVLAGMSVVTLIAGAGLTFTGCATTSCSGKTSCSGMQKEGSQTSCSGKTSCSGGGGDKKTGCGCDSGCSGKE